MPEDSNKPRSEEEAAAALEEARRLGPFGEVLARAGPFIRTLTSNPEIDPRDAFTLAVLAQALFMLGQLRDEVREMRGEGT